uniref:Uncharacterized protein n=1 Tax=Ixodes ricinus TaxID=34613 RepID=A0A6B0UMV9_IXORI
MSHHWPSQSRPLQSHVFLALWWRRFQALDMYSGTTLKCCSFVRLIVVLCLLPLFWHLHLRCSSELSTRFESCSGGLSTNRTSWYPLKLRCRIWGLHRTTWRQPTAKRHRWRVPDLLLNWL